MPKRGSKKKPQVSKLTSESDSAHVDHVGALSLAVANCKHILDDDARAIRSTCKQLKHAVDEAGFKTMLHISINDRFSVSRPPRVLNFKAIAASSILQSIQYLHFGFYSDDLREISKYIRRLQPILERLAPQLVYLGFSSDQLHCPFGPCFLKKLAFPKLKTLEVTPVKISDVLNSCKVGLHAMPELESLKLWCEADNKEVICQLGGLAAEDYEVLSEAPFLQKLTFLSFSSHLMDINDDDPRELEVVEPMASLFSQTANLELLEIQKAASFACFDSNSNLGKLRKMQVKYARYDLVDYSAFIALEHLNLIECKCRKAALEAIAGAPGRISHLPLLKSLTLDTIDRMRTKANDQLLDNDKREYWHWLARLNLPSLESIDFSFCECFSQADFFRIGAAAINLPKLKHFSIVNRKADDDGDGEEDEEVYRTFFLSSLAAQLESFKLFLYYPEPLICAFSIEYAPRMDNMRHFDITFHEWEQYFEFVAAGRAGVLPNLRVLWVTWEIDEPPPSPVDGMPDTEDPNAELEEIWPLANVGSNRNSFRRPSKDILREGEDPNSFVSFEFDVGEIIPESSDDDSDSIPDSDASSDDWSSGGGRGVTEEIQLR
jgi:hypothetical protein